MCLQLPCVNLVSMLAMSMPLPIWSGLRPPELAGGRVAPCSSWLNDSAKVTRDDLNATVFTFAMFFFSQGDGFTPTRLRALDTPPESIVGAIVRGDQVIVPRGDDEIRPRDRLLVFATAASVPHIRNYFGDAAER